MDGRLVGEKQKGVKRKRSESSDSESDNEEGRITARPYRRARPFSLFTLVMLYPCSYSLNSLCMSCLSCIVFQGCVCSIS